MANLALTFLAPTAGIVAAAIAGPALLLLYFLKLRRKPLRVSSTLFWAQATADLQVNAPFRWLRFSWLLLLQALLLACFIIAVARPAMDLEGQTSHLMAIVLDRSASMGARDGTPDATGTPRTRLEEAKARATELVDRLPSDARAMVVAFGRRSEILTSLTADRALLRRAIASVALSDESGDLTTALRVVGPSLSGSTDPESDESPIAVLFTDGAFEEPPEGSAQAAAALGRTRVEFLRVGPSEEAQSDNVGIVALAARRDYEDPALIRLFVRVQSVVGEPVDVGLSFAMDGTPIASTPLRIPGATDLPGETSHTFSFAAPEGGLATVAIIRSDVLEADDSAAIVLKRPQPPRILLVQPNMPSEIVDFLTAEALETLSPAEVRVVTLGQYEELAPEVLGAFSLIVFDRTRPRALPTAPSISFGAGLPIPGVSVAPYPDDDPAGRPTTFAFWQRTHPILRYAALGGVPIGRPLQLTLPTTSAGGPAIITETLASGAAGPLIALIEQSGTRRLVVAFELRDSRWWQDASFPVFLKNAADYLTLSGDEHAGVLHQPGATVTVAPAPGAGTIRVSGPVSFERPAPAEAIGRVSIGALPRAGVYRIQGVAMDEEVIAVSMLDPFESEVRTRDRISIGGRSLEAGGSGGAAPREIWHWFVLAALVLLTIEWVAYAWRMRV